MSSENIPVNTADTNDGTNADSVTESNGSNLINFDENNTVTTGKDINSKITSLDIDLAQLRMELGSINNSVEEGLDRLGDTDTDLTAKVSETYKRLGEIDNAYKSLLVISSRIDRDIQKLDGDVSAVAEQSASGIMNLEKSTLVQSHEFTQKNQKVASKVSQLVETSKLTSELLGQKIQSTTDMMLQIEKRVIGEIENLANVTKDKTDSLYSSVDINKAKIIKLQAIDEAIIRRSTTLEISSAELTVSSQRLDASVEQLGLSSDVLSHGIDTLKDRADALEELTSNHGMLIGGLQKATSDVAEKLAVLTGRESKHFNIMTAGFLLLLVIIAVIYFAQQSQFGLNDARYSDRSEIVDSEISSLQQVHATSEVATNESLAVLENKIERVNDKMQTMQDQVQSVDGRLSQSSPFSSIGDDNVIHGEKWISSLPRENFIVQLAYANDKDAMYKIAQRYNHYLKDKLSYFEANENGVTKYVLLSGNYTTQKQALAAVDSMPGYINSQRPQVKKLGAVQNYIAK